MRCFKCKKLSLSAICKDCQKLYFITTPSKRELANLEVISFFDYFVIEDFIKSKYDASGYKIYKLFAKEYLLPFLKEYSQVQKESYYLIGVDENSKRDYSPISVLLYYGTKGVQNIKPLYHVLEAKNKVVYAGESLEFRLKHPRDFTYNGPVNIKAILLDDLITTGLTLQEAYGVLKRCSVEVEFALTLANAKKGIDF